VLLENQSALRACGRSRAHHDGRRRVDSDGIDANGVRTFAVPRFHLGTTPPGGARPIAEQIRVAFPKKGRYLAICMNRAHSFNDWMFAFIDLVGSDGDD
jgi:hypothetical protein